VTARHCFADLERDYVVVTWEQPGAAKSYSAINPADITLEAYLTDGAAVTEILRREFGQDRIYLMGESWGSALGLMMAREHPEHYRAFIGTGQMVDFLETERIDYQMALEDARRTGNKKLVDKLEEQGPPPYESGIALKTNAYLSPLYGTSARTGRLRGATFSTMDGPYGVEYGLLDKVAFFWGLYRTFDSVYGRLYPIDLRKSAAEQQIPVHIFHGRYDYNAPTSLVEDYYARLRAPRKSLVYFEHSGHNPWQTENELFIDHVRRAFAERGWAGKLAMAQLAARWSEIVGPQIAEHAEVVSFEIGRLELRASSSAWAQQLRLLMPTIQRAVDEEMRRARPRNPPRVEIRVLGPSAPDWTRGRFGPVRGARGPRDTYG